MYSAKIVKFSAVSNKSVENQIRRGNYFCLNKKPLELFFISGCGRSSGCSTFCLVSVFNKGTGNCLSYFFLAFLTIQIAFIVVVCHKSGFDQYRGHLSGVQYPKTFLALPHA